MSQVPSWVRKYLGFLWVRHGREQGSWDCWGLVLAVHKNEFGNELPGYDGRYSLAPSRATFDEIVSIDTPWDRVSLEAAQLGDVIAFSDKDFGIHTGLMLTRDRFLHVTKGITSRVERLEDQPWVNRVVGVFRYKGGALRIDTDQHC